MGYRAGRMGLWVVLTAALVVGLVACNDDDATVALDSSNGTGTSDGSGNGDGGSSGAVAMVCDENAEATPAGSYDAVTQSTDITGDTIDVHMTVFVPALDDGECAPLIVHSHGFGGSRLTSLADIEDDEDASTVATRDAWRHGYYVISFDQRGFGETGGEVKVENPDFEGRDTRAVVDYAESHLGGHLAYAHGDPLVGSLGLSYGGGFQLVGAAMDPRFDAIVPAATWYALPYSLNPNDTPKTVWIDLLVALGVTGSGGALDDFLYQGFLQAQTGEFSDDVIDAVRGNGLNAFCEGGRNEGVPRVDAFLVQGATDTLFNMNEAVANAQCLRRAGNDVRLLGRVNTTGARRAGGHFAARQGVGSAV